MEVILSYVKIIVIKKMIGENLLIRIIYNFKKCGGRFCIWGMWICVFDILEMLVENVSRMEILEDFFDLEVEDI